MNKPYFSPAWSRQHSLAEHALSQFIPAMRLSTQPAQFWDAYWFVIDLRNELLEKERRA